MSIIATRLWSSVGKKLITGITGLALVGFLVAHLIGNLLILVGQEEFNNYAYFLHHVGHGAVVILAEIALLLFFGFHVVTGVAIWLKKRKATGGSRYKVSGSAGGPSRKTASSQSMILTGIILLLFVVLHIIHFKFGPDASMGYEYTNENDQEIRDLFRLVIESFHNPIMVGLYVFTMLLLGLHLRHGVWSALQSVGASNPKLTPLLYTAGGALALVLSFGFLLLPLFIYFGIFVDVPVDASQELQQTGTTP